MSSPRGPGSRFAATRVLVVDTELPAPRLSQHADRYGHAWVVIRRADRPRSLVEVDLGPDGVASRDHFATVFDRIRTADDLIGGIPVVADELLPSLSVVIPTMAERLAALEACLASIHTSGLPWVEILVVDNRPTVPVPDPLPGLVGQFRDARVVRQSHPGIAAARNAGVAAATGDVVVFTDDDVQADPVWLRAMAGRFALHPEETAVTGLVLPSELETPAQMWFERYYGGFAAERAFEPLTYRLARPDASAWRRSTVVGQDSDGRVVRRFAIYGAGACGAGCNMAFRRAALRGRSPFDTALGTGTPAQGGEDLAAIIGLLWNGGLLGFEPAALVYHQHRRDYPALRRQMRAYGAGFTAMLTGLIARDPTHALGVGAQLPRALGRLATSTAVRLRGVRPAGDDHVAVPEDRDPHEIGDGDESGRGYPAALTRDELGGLISGPVLYGRSRWAERVRRQRSVLQAPVPGTTTASVVLRRDRGPTAPRPPIQLTIATEPAASRRGQP
ncbi:MULTISPECIES: glycosyltransferase [unclassified Pseudonocardia]|uniref:glycosyltransferase n=1 Tax=unclassified Pseudonocardia TaxID=2619320 RepID=UPI00095F0819|nr:MULTISPECIES: glycosyltransferase [unclassified Pseudonocardia]MBN9098046.1 glycosyltransferase [Pseudonocardia sp.]OJY40244.1 MAG: hypothetical protein BGP03_00005 [Pseudonocardia sp. 73-21]